MGLSPPGSQMSMNEFTWWVARSSKKPLPCVRDEFFNARSVYFSYGNSGSDRPYRSLGDAVIDWFKVDELDDEDFLEIAKKVIKEKKNG